MQRKIWSILVKGEVKMKIEEKIKSDRSGLAEILQYY